MFYVYILKSMKDQKLYTGYTADLKRRLIEHTQGKTTSLRHRTPLELMYYEAYKSQADAKKREYMLKKSAGARTALKRRLGASLRSGRFV